MPDGREIENDAAALSAKAARAMSAEKATLVEDATLDGGLDDFRFVEEDRRPYRWDSEREYELMCVMAESASGLPKGMDVRVEECEYTQSDGTSISVPVMTVGTGGERLPVYFHRGYAFHPDTKAVEIQGSAVAQTCDRPGHIVVVDTGWLPDTREGHVYPGEVDTIRDAVSGHGPAIVRLIRSVNRSEGLEVDLMQVRYDQGLVGGPIEFDAPTSPGVKVRGFDELALSATMKELASRLDPDRSTVVNLSLGAVSCPDRMLNDPIGKMIAQHPDTRFVVAAGNHSNEVPSWPAVYASGRPSTPSLSSVVTHSNVVSVGSGTAQTPDSFSARGPWVREWQGGSDVPVHHDGMPSKPGTNAEWSGTSFAAPRYAAQIV